MRSKGEFEMVLFEGLAWWDGCDWGSPRWNQLLRSAALRYTGFLLYVI